MVKYINILKFNLAENLQPIVYMLCIYTHCIIREVFLILSMLQQCQKTCYRDTYMFKSLLTTLSA